MNDAVSPVPGSLSSVVAAAAPLVCAIRTGPSRHITGLVCERDAIVTIAQALPVQDRHFVVLPNRLPIAALPGPRDPTLNLAVLRLDTTWPAVSPTIAQTAVGNMAIIVGADEDGCPTVRLTVIHRFRRSADGPVPVLDLSADRLEQGSLVLDQDARLIGLLATGPENEALAIPSAMIGRMLLPDAAPSNPNALTPPASGRRGWLGVALQPITVPEELVARVGQPSGRMVVSITKGGPAELAGIRIGDVLLALDGTSASGPQSMRAFLDSDRVGTTVEVKLLRDGVVVATRLTIAVHPA
jgi:hypothetical protein